MIRTIQDCKKIAAVREQANIPSNEAIKELQEYACLYKIEAFICKLKIKAINGGSEMIVADTIHKELRGELSEKRYWELLKDLCKSASIRYTKVDSKFDLIPYKFTEKFEW